MMKSCVLLVLFAWFVMSTTIANPVDINVHGVYTSEESPKHSLGRGTKHMKHVVMSLDLQGPQYKLQYKEQKTNFGRVLQLSDYSDSGANNPPPQRLMEIGDTLSNENGEKAIYVDDDNQSLLWVDSPEQSLSRSEDLHTDGLNNRKLQTEAAKRLPQALIIGVKKSGTRALLEFLRIHPNIQAPGPEPHFFDRHYNKGLEWYRQQMPATLEDQITIEKTPSYFVTKEVPKRIYDMNKHIKLIVVVRDPVTRAISDYTQAATKRPNMKPFEKMAFIDNTSRIVDTKWGAVRIGVYAKHLEKWLKYFPLTQIHFVNGEKLVSDPAGEMSRVQDFLGLKRLVTDKHFYFKDSWGFPCLKKNPVGGHPHCLRNNKGRKHPQVELNVLNRLRDFFRPFNLKFYQLTNIDFGWS